MTLVESSRLLRAFAWARLALAGLLIVTIPFTASDFAPDANVPILTLALLAAAGSSWIILGRRVLPAPRRIAALVSTLDVVLITAVVAGTGGPRSIYPFLYVLSVTAACVLLPRAGALAIGASASLLYTGLVFGRTVVPIAYLFEPPQPTSALEVVTMFMNSATFLVVAIVAGGVAERYRATHLELETRRRDLRDLEAFRDLVFDCVGTGLVVLDRDDRVTAFNRAAAEITGRDTVFILGAHWSTIASQIDLPEIITALSPPEVTSVRRETTVHRPDGVAAPVSMTFSTLRSAAGEALGLVVACEDLSTIRRMEARMRHADRLATLGRLSANIAHEIRNPLASMTGAIEALTTTSAALASDEREKLTEIVQRESGRLNRIVGEFLAYARPAPLAPQRIDLAAVLEEVLVLLQHRPLPSTIKLVRAFEGPLWADVDSGAVRQALWNLCLNALDAMPDGGELVIGATALATGLRISITDSGVGIPSGDLAHIFEPFYSTKPQGSGLGLALVHRVMRDHGGDVDVRTAPDTGTTFTLLLPPSHG